MFVLALGIVDGFLFFFRLGSGGGPVRTDVLSVKLRTGVALLRLLSLTLGRGEVGLDEEGCGDVGRCDVRLGDGGRGDVGLGEVGRGDVGLGDVGRGDIGRLLLA